MNYFLFFAIYFVICIGIFYVYFYFNIPSIPKLPKNIKVFDVNNVNNGDLIFLSGTTFGENVCKFFGMCEFSHVGLLFVENDVVYILEADLGQNSAAGTRIMKLQDKLQRFKGDKIMGIRRLNKEIKTESILQFFEKTKHLDFDDLFASWVVAGSILEILAKNPNTVFCSEYIAMCLQCLGVLPDYVNPISISPRDLMINIKPRIPFSYSSVVYFAF